MGVFSELDLENQQAEMEKTASESSEIQTLQAKLIQQHEQKKAAAASEVPSKEPAAEPAAVVEQDFDQPVFRHEEDPEGYAPAAEPAPAPEAGEEASLPQEAASADKEENE